MNTPHIDLSKVKETNEELLSDGSVKYLAWCVRMGAANEYRTKLWDRRGEVALAVDGGNPEYVTSYDALLRLEAKHLQEVAESANLTGAQRDQVAFHIGHHEEGK